MKIEWHNPKPRMMWVWNDDREYDNEWQEPLIEVEE